MIKGDISAAIESVPVNCSLPLNVPNLEPCSSAFESSSELSIDSNTIDDERPGFKMTNSFENVLVTEFENIDFKDIAALFVWSSRV